MSSKFLLKQQSDRDKFLDDCYEEGIRFAEALQQWMILYATRCNELRIDKSAVKAFGTPVGWNSTAWGKAAYRFPKWFDGKIAEEYPELLDQTKHAPTSWQLMTLQKFSTVSFAKSVELYGRWIKAGASWTVTEVEDALDECKGRQGCGESLKIDADVKFDAKGQVIVAKPAEKISWDRGNGAYVVRFRKKKEKK
jgi:hypothetical protein